MSTVTFGGWHLVQTLRPVSALEPSSTTIAVPSKPRTPDLKLAGKLFGNSVPVVNQMTAVTRQDVKLVGVIVTDDPTSSLALFDIDGVQSSVKTGEILPDGEILKSVSPLSVILSQRGEERMLESDLRAAPIDAVFQTLPFGQEELIAAMPVTAAPTAKPLPVTPASEQLLALRQAAVQVLANRANSSSTTLPQTRN